MITAPTPDVDSNFANELDQSIEDLISSFNNDGSARVRSET